ncbi:LOW QUALITY PROTEIN: hypothetical protein TorRG33x02_167510, partial [Trema orientale]
TPHRHIEPSTGLEWTGPAASSSHAAPRAPTRAYPSLLSPKFTPLIHFLIDPSPPVSSLTLETSPLVSALRASFSYSSAFFLLEQVHRRSPFEVWTLLFLLGHSSLSQGVIYSSLFFTFPCFLSLFSLLGFLPFTSFSSCLGEKKVEFSWWVFVLEPRVCILG